ncbi:hypothetical protein QBC43DRAFT_307964 [Cladorrhinum sp. PSN259]|nr:hypothetical protein QBC43DRAFT_307964 [Cladorrhinum sp. PSN259]
MPTMEQSQKQFFSPIPRAIKSVERRAGKFLASRGVSDKISHHDNRFDTPITWEHSVDQEQRKSETRIVGLQKALTEQEQERKLLESQIHHHYRNQVQALERELAKAQSDIQKAVTEQEQERKRLESQIHHHYRNQVQALERELAKAQSEKQKAALANQQVVERLELESEDIRKAHRAALDQKQDLKIELQKDYEEKLSQKDKKLNHNVGKLKMEHEKERANMMMRYNEDVEARANEVSFLAARHKAEIEKLRATYEVELDQTLSKRFEELKKRDEQEPSVMKIHNDELEQLRARQYALLKDLESKHKQEVEMKDRKISALGAAYRVEEERAKRNQQRHAADVTKRHNDELEQLRAIQDVLMKDLESKHQQEVEIMDRQVSALSARHDEELANITNSLLTKHAEELQATKQQVAGDTARATKKSRALIQRQQQQIASYSKDDYAYGIIDDQTFASAFQEVAQAVNQLVSQVDHPQGINSNKVFDSTRILERYSSQRDWIWPRFLRNTCWDILLTGFFSIPLGFGALGNLGEGHQYMHPTYEAAAIFNNLNSRSNSLRNDKETNVYRALHFRRILAAIKSDNKPGGTLSSSESTLAIMFEKNVKQVSRVIYYTLGVNATEPLHPDLEKHAFKLSHRLGLLALEMGSQRSQILMQRCQFKDRVSSVEWSAEEASATAPTSSSQTVDFMVHPCLSRIGDGREELTKKTVLVKGEYVPLYG